MASRDINDLCPELLIICKEFLAQCTAANISVHIDCTYRSDEEQNDDYAKGRTVPGHIITNAKAGQSAHNCKTSDDTPAARAFDIYILSDDKTLNWDISSLSWQTVIQIGEGLGLTCGAHFKSIPDYPHFQLDAKFP